MPREPRLPVWLLWTCLLAILPPAPGPAGAAADAGRRLGQADLAALADQYPGNEPLLLFHRQEADLRYEPARDGFFGEIVEEREVWLRGSDRLDEFARVLKVEAPLLRVVDLRIEILSPGREKPRRVDADGLTWRAAGDVDTDSIVLDRTVVSAVVPGLSRGDRLRVRRILSCRGLHGLPAFAFGADDMRCVASEVRLTLPADHLLAHELVGPAALIEKLSWERATAGSRQVQIWRASDLPPERSQGDHRPDSPPPLRLALVPHVSSVDAPLRPDAFAVSANWQDAAQGYARRIESTLEATPEIREIAAGLAAGSADRREALSRLYAHVQRTTRYLALIEGEGGVIPDAADLVRRHGYGDCKGLSAYLISLCRALDIEAHPVLVRTSHLGPLATGVPNMAQFNHFLVWADDGEAGCWLDPTVHGFPAGVLPLADACWPVLPIRPDCAGLSEIPRAAWKPGSFVVTVRGILDPGGVLHLRVDLAADGAQGAGLAATALTAPAGVWQDRLYRLLLPASLPMSADEEATPTAAVKGGEQVGGEPAAWSLTAVSKQALPGAGGRLFLPKVLPALDSHLIDSRDDSASVDLRRIPDRQESWWIELPAGWRLAAPETLCAQGAGLNWHRSVWQEAGSLRLERRLEWTADRVEVNDAAELRSAQTAALAAERGYFTLQR